MRTPTKPMSIFMNPRVETRERALRLAVRTGKAVDLDFIWGSQRHEGFEACFGNPKPDCPKTCRWSARCKAVAAEAVHTPWVADDMPYPRLTGYPSGARSNAVLSLPLATR